VTPTFDQEFRERLTALMQWRRDVRRFRTDPIPEHLFDALLDLAQFAPSVGNSQPWRFVRIVSAEARAAIRGNFLRCNRDALDAFSGEQARRYASLKLEGLDHAPIQLAVFCDHGTRQGHGLGARTMPETLDYSVAGMIAMLWLVARAQGIGMGWISILDPAEVKQTLAVPPDYVLIAYLCFGWPEEEHDDPELVRFDWQQRTGDGRVVPRV
jgi:5,6-dimethylbenzimidazole synthase